jgi:hypothetical protein
LEVVLVGEALLGWEALLCCQHLSLLLLSFFLFPLLLLVAKPYNPCTLIKEFDNLEIPACPSPPFTHNAWVACRFPFPSSAELQHVLQALHLKTGMLGCNTKEIEIICSLLPRMRGERGWRGVHNRH